MKELYDLYMEAQITSIIAMTGFLVFMILAIIC